MPERILTGTDSGSVVDLVRGADATVELDEIPTTGNRWALDGPLPSGLTLVSDDYVPPAEAIGGRGRRRFRFRADGPVRGALSLKLWRDWAGDSSIIERFRVTFRS
jgi:inhibitor of cysteine peptidase